MSCHLFLNIFRTASLCRDCTYAQYNSTNLSYPMRDMPFVVKSQIQFAPSSCTYSKLSLGAVGISPAIAQNTICLVWSVSRKPMSEHKSQEKSTTVYDKKSPIKYDDLHKKYIHGFCLLYNIHFFYVCKHFVKNIHM